MADVHIKEIRSFNMSKIKGKNTKPEMLVRKYLFANGLRYRLHQKKLPGSPDLIFPQYKAAVFVHGCFWHGHDGCKYFVVPKTKTDWWLDKIGKTKDRDKKARHDLESLGWKVLCIWECELRKEPETVLKNLANAIVAVGNRGRNKEIE